VSPEKVSNQEKKPGLRKKPACEDQRRFEAIERILDLAVNHTKLIFSLPLNNF